MDEEGCGTLFGGLRGFELGGGGLWEPDCGESGYGLGCVGWVVLQITAGS
jgi:hypothetical protein